MHSNAVVWEDEFLLKQVIEFTGDYLISPDFQTVSQRKYTNLVEHLSNIDTSKVSKLNINSGWLLNTDIDSIESLKRSKKVWIISNGKTINLVPLPGSITTVDSKRELIDYSLEFQINPTYNEESHRLYF